MRCTKLSSAFSLDIALNSARSAFRSRLASRASSSALRHSTKQSGIEAKAALIAALRSRVILVASRIATCPSPARKAWAIARALRAMASRTSWPAALAAAKKSAEEVRSSGSIWRRNLPLLKIRALTPSNSRVRHNLRAMVDLPRAGRPTMAITSFPFIATPFCSL